MKKFLIVFTCALLLNACATQPVYLKKEAISSIDSVDQSLIIPQSHLDVTVKATNPGNTGLLGALIVGVIDSVRESNAEDEATPIIEKLKNYDFRQEMLDAMEKQYSNFENPSYKINSSTETADLESIRSVNFEQSNSDAILYTVINYKLISGELVVTANAQMYPKSNNLMSYRKEPNDANKLDEGNIIYRNKFTYNQPQVYVSNIESSLENAANDIAKQIMVDLMYTK